MKTYTYFHLAICLLTYAYPIGSITPRYMAHRHFEIRDLIGRLPRASKPEQGRPSNQIQLSVKLQPKSTTSEPPLENEPERQLMSETDNQFYKAEQRVRRDPSYSALAEPMLSSSSDHEVRDRDEAQPEPITNVFSYKVMNQVKQRPNLRFLLAYDCSRPQNIKATSSIITDDCSSKNIKDVEVDQQTRSYQLLQEQRNWEVPGFRCERKVSRTVIYCGNYDHMTISPDLGMSNRPVPLTRDECLRMARGRYRDGKGDTHTTALDTWLHARYYKAGKVYVGHDSTLGGSELKCSGTTIMINSESIDRAIVFLEESIIVRKERLIQRNDNSLVAFYENVRLSCPLEDGGCEEGPVTYVWKPPKMDRCHLKVAKTFSARLTVSPDVSETILMSTDGSKYRFVLGPNLSKCGRSVITTEYSDLFLYDTRDHEGTVRPDLFTDKLRPGDVNLRNYIANRDDFLYHLLKDQLRKEFVTVWAHNCQRQLKDTRLAHYVTRKFNGFHTYSYGGNSFLTTAGEVVYTYLCQPRLTQALETAFCYDALPVAVIKNGDGDRQQGIDVLQTPAGAVTVPEYFLEPLTHRLTKVATVIPCTAGFQSRYRDVLGRWFAVTPRIIAVEPPAEIRISEVQQPNRTTDYSFASGGIYSDEEVEGLQDYLEFPRIQSAVTYKLADQAHNIRPETSITPDILFPPHAIPSGSWTTFILGSLWGKLRRLGEMASIFVGGFLLLKSLWAIFKVLASAYHMIMSYGCSLQVLWACCPETLFTLKHFGELRERGMSRFNRLGNPCSELCGKSNETLEPATSTPCPTIHNSSMRCEAHREDVVSAPPAYCERPIVTGHWPDDTPVPERHPHLHRSPTHHHGLVEAPNR